MTDIDAALQDERLARVMLTIASEPGDAVTGRLIRTVGPSETVRLAMEPFDVDMSAQTDVDAWRRRLAPRLSEESARRAMETSDRLGMRMLVPGDSEWPVSMQRWHDHGPVALWTIGAVEHLSAPSSSVGLIGARAATGYGAYIAGELASGSVDAGHVVVSGGAYGIDAAAHRAALIAGGTTVAVLAGGLDRLYPAGNQGLFDRIAEAGLLVTELPPGAAPTRHRFQQRGRLIAALSSAVVVVEAGYRSGALLTAAQASEIGRQVGAVPGPITSAASAGCHRLMRDDLAGLVTGMDDVTLMLRRAGAYPPKTLTPDLSVQVSSSSISTRTTGPSL